MQDIAQEDVKKQWSVATSHRMNTKTKFSSAMIQVEDLS